MPTISNKRLDRTIKSIVDDPYKRNRMMMALAVYYMKEYQDVYFLRFKSCLGELLLFNLLFKKIKYIYFVVTGKHNADEKEFLNIYIRHTACIGAEPRQPLGQGNDFVGYENVNDFEIEIAKANDPKRYFIRKQFFIDNDKLEVPKEQVLVKSKDPKSKSKRNNKKTITNQNQEISLVITDELI